MLSFGGLVCRVLRCGSRRSGNSEHTAKSAAEKSAPDNLTAIRGIGIAGQNRLYAAGIKTYAQLAEASPEALRNIVGKLGRGTKVEDCIAQARDLAGNI